MRNKTNHTPLTRGSRLTDAKLLLIITDQFYFYFFRTCTRLLCV